jgi:hypothetical protein
MHRPTTKTQASCTHCGEVFIRRAPQQTYCSERCRVAAFRRAANARNAGRVSEAQNEKITSPRSIPPDEAKYSPDISTGSVTHRTGGRSGICGPSWVLAVEIYPRTVLVGERDERRPPEHNRSAPETAANRPQRPQEVPRATASKVEGRA